MWHNSVGAWLCLAKDPPVGASQTGKQSCPHRVEICPAWNPHGEQLIYRKTGSLFTAGQDMPQGKKVCRLFCLWMLWRHYTLVLIILPRWAYEVLDTFCFSALVLLLLYLLSLVVGCQNCPILGLLLIVLNSEALKLMGLNSPC